MTLVIIGERKHTFPSRTRSLSSQPPMVVRPRCCARVGCCQYYEAVSRNANGFSSFICILLLFTNTKVFRSKCFGEKLRVSKEPSVASTETIRIALCTTKSRVQTRLLPVLWHTLPKSWPLLFVSSTISLLIHTQNNIWSLISTIPSYLISTFLTFVMALFIRTTIIFLYNL